MNMLIANSNSYTLGQYNVTIIKIGFVIRRVDKKLYYEGMVSKYASIYRFSELERGIYD